MAILLGIKQYLSNIWSSIHEKVKQHWGRVEKSAAFKKSVYSHKIIEIKERPQRHLLHLTSIHWKWIKKQSSVILEPDNIRKKRLQKLQKLE